MHKHICVLQIVFGLTQPFKKISQTVVRISIAIPLFILVGVNGFVSRQLPGAGSSLRSVAGLEDVSDESCGGDVDDELLPELVDNPGTTRGTKLSVLHIIVFPSLVNGGFDTDPRKGISVVFEEFS